MLTRIQQSYFAFIVMLGAFVCALTAIQLHRFNLLGAQAFDLGIFQQGVWLLAHGYAPFVTVRGWHLFADHFSPILYLFVPFYRLYPHPLWLFLGQTLALALGALPLYRLSLRHTKSHKIATLIAIGYLLHPAIGTMLFFDFHLILLSVPFVLWAMDALDAERPFPFFIACALALLCREDIAVSVACLSLYGLLVQRKQWAGAMGVVSVAWFLFATKTMALFAFFPLFSGSFTLFALPNYAVLALSDWRAMRELGFQHAALIAPWLATSVPLAFRRLLASVRESDRGQWQKVLALTFGLCLAVSFSRFVPHTYKHFFSLTMPSEKAQRIRSFLAQTIPPDASVSAPSQFVPHLAHRRAIYLFPNPFQRAGYGPSPTTLKQLDGRLWVKPLPAKTLHRRMSEKEVTYIVLKAG